MGPEIFIVDAFADRPFAGNPAAVVLLEEPASESWMRSVAREMNLSETAFVVKGPKVMGLRWFTPVAEVALCGHATLASAQVVWTLQYRSREDPIRFSTKSGKLVCEVDDERIRMRFPARVARPMDPPPGLLEALGVDARAVPFVGRAGTDYLVELADAAAVRAVRPDFRALASIETRGTIVTARADDAAHDFVSRFFATAVGIDEDPVTGSAHCALAPFWTERLSPSSDGWLLGRQCSARGGTVGVKYEEGLVLLRGRARIMVSGRLSSEAAPV